MITVKRLWIVLTILMIATNGYCASQWAKLEPLGTRSGADIDAYQTVNNEALDRLNYNYRRGLVVMANSSAQVSVLAGEVAIPNSGGTVVRWRRITATTTVTWANIDAGAEAASTQYYVYAVGDADATTCTFMISTSATAPTGATYYRKIGYFYNNSSSNIVNVGNIKDSDAPNIMSVTGTDDITSTSTTYEDMTDMEIRFVSNGRPTKITFSAPMYVSAATTTPYLTIDIDGTDKILGRPESGSISPEQVNMVWLETLTAGTHIIKVQWKVAGGTIYQGGSTYGTRILIAEEF